MTTSADSSAAPPLGLRERSKARRRALIIQTAMRLFAERGYTHTTVADIAEAAELAPRTVAGYFPTKPWSTPTPVQKSQPVVALCVPQLPDVISVKYELNPMLL